MENHASKPFYFTTSILMGSAESYRGSSTLSKEGSSASRAALGSKRGKSAIVGCSGESLAAARFANSECDVQSMQVRAYHKGLYMAALWGAKKARAQHWLNFVSASQLHNDYPFRLEGQSLHKRNAKSKQCLRSSEHERSDRLLERLSALYGHNKTQSSLDESSDEEDEIGSFYRVLSYMAQLYKYS